MSFKVIDPNEIDTRTLADKYPPLPQRGPLRFYDRSSPCIAGSKGHRCGSPAYHKVNGLPYCMKHALFILNDIICELTGEGEGLDASGTEGRNQRELGCAAP